jgi:DNA-binding response OmpR family regulator
VREILIIEDDTLLSSVVARIVRAAGFKPVRALSLADGLAQIERTQFHMVLADYVIASGSGFDVLRTMKERWPSVPVIIMSGTGADEVRASARAAGARGYLEKPFSVERLIEAITEATSPSPARGCA